MSRATCTAGETVAPVSKVLQPNRHSNTARNVSLVYYDAGMVGSGRLPRQVLEVFEMKIKRGAVIAALIATLLAVGTAFAASPTLVPQISGHSPSAESPASAKPSEKAEASETAEASAKAEPSEAADASEAAEVPDAAEAAPSAKELASVLSDLTAAGIPATADELQTLAAKVGLGGAVRVLTFANASGKSPDAILAMFESGKGWGEIAKELNLTIGPGIGGIMSRGHGHHQSAGAKP